MGRLLTVVGVLMLLVGIGGMIFSFVMPFLNPGNSMFNPAADAIKAAQEGPKAEDLCNAGETILTQEGPSDYDPVTGDTRHPILVFCVDDAGNRRDVTEKFAGNLIGTALNSLPGFLGGLGLTCIFSSLIPLGVILIVIGMVVSRRGKARVVTVGAGGPGGQIYTMPSGNSSFTRVPHSSAAGADLTARLRQLEEAKAKGLISDAEYERMRQQILDSMQ